jgi:glycosyltransferase involved in cell wall biosynthesis
MNAKMVIGFDAKRIVSNGTGLGSYGRTLVNDLARREEDMALHLYAPAPGRDDLRQQLVKTDRLTIHDGGPEGRHFKGLWRTKGIVNDLKRDGIQLYHGLSGELPIGIRKSGIKSVVTIHDLIFLRHPEYYHWIDTKIYAWKFRQAIKEANQIIAISECTKRDIIEFGGVDERRITLIYQSYAPRFSAEKDQQKLEEVSHHYQLPKRYMLSVGTIEARKNILLAVKALPHLPEDLGLVMVGRHTAYTDEVVTYAEKHGLRGRIHILHGVPDEHLPALYAMAETFVYPSRYEGFGIPIIEAISSGLPVVACTGSCLEEAGGPDSLYVDPDDEQAMANAISQVLKGAEGREQRIRLSQDYIRRFEGNDVAGQIVDLYQSLL